MNANTLKNIMKKAHEIARAGVKRFGGSYSVALAAAMKMAWETQKNGVKKMRSSAEIKKELEQKQKLNTNHSRSMNEGADGYQHELYSTAALIDELTAALDTEFTAEWTESVYETRRAAWNAAVNAAAEKKEVLNGLWIQKTEARLGYGMYELKQAKTILGK